MIATNETGGRRSKSNTAGAKIKVTLILDIRINILPYDLRQTFVLHLLSFSRIKACVIRGLLLLIDTKLVAFMKLNPFRLCWTNESYSRDQCMKFVYLNCGSKLFRGN